MLYGLLNCAWLGLPFVVPEVLSPTKVVTTPVEVTARIRWFPVSAT